MKCLQKIFTWIFSWFWMQKLFPRNFFSKCSLSIFSYQNYFKFFSRFFLEFFWKYFYHKTTKKLLKRKKENGRKIERREGSLPSTVNQHPPCRSLFFWSSAGVFFCALPLALALLEDGISHLKKGKKKMLGAPSNGRWASKLWSIFFPHIIDRPTKLPNSKCPIITCSFA